MQFYFLGYNYATCLSIEILFKLRHRSNLYFTKRLFLYHFSSWLLASLFSILLGAFKGYGVSGFNTCSIDELKSIHYLEFVPFGMNLPIM